MLYALFILKIFRLYSVYYVRDWSLNIGVHIIGTGCYEQVVQELRWGNHSVSNVL